MNEGEDEADRADGPSFSWEVGEDLIDLDHWARSYVAVRVEEKEQAFSPFFRHGFWPILALTVVVIGVTSSVPLAAVSLVVIASMPIGAKAWNRSEATRMAKRLRAIPAASDPFTFRAVSNGTEGRSATGADNLAWSRYTGVGIHDDLVFLRQDTGALLFLPIAGLTSGHSAVAAVHSISGWIEAARPTA